MRAAIYSRVSSDPRHQGRSVAEQQADCRQVAEREGWKVVKIFTDNDKSASRYAKLPRHAYAQLVEYVRQGGCDVLVTWEASRFQRDLEDYVRLRELCRRQGVLWSYNGRVYDLSRTDDRLSTGLDALLAERESDMTRERVLRAVRANAVQGRPHGRLLFGYSREYDNGEFVRQVINEEQATLIREAAKRFIGGEAANSIAKDWNARNIPTPHNGKWDLTRIRRILTNPAYIAQRVHQGEVIGQGNWPPILDEPTYYRCIARFSDPQRKTYRDAAVRYLLSGIARCGVCDNALKGFKPRGYPSYTCVPNFCVARKIESVDALVTELILARLSQPDALTAFQGDDDTQDILEDIAEKKARLEGFYDAAATGQISPGALARIEGTLLGEIADLKRQLQRLDVPTAYYELAKAPERVWPTLDITQQRAIVRLLVQVRILPTQRGRRSLDPETVVVTWRGSLAAPPVARPTAAEPSQAAS